MKLLSWLWNHDATLEVPKSPSQTYIKKFKAPTRIHVSKDEHADRYYLSFWNDGYSKEHPVFSYSMDDETRKKLIKDLRRYVKTDDVLSD